MYCPCRTFKFSYRLECGQTNNREKNSSLAPIDISLDHKQTKRTNSMLGEKVGKWHQFKFIFKKKEEKPENLFLQ